MADEIAIKVENVSKDFSYSRRKAVTVKSAFTGVLRRKTKDDKNIQHALKNISFEVKKGEFFGIVGRNGSGKSTLLKILAGIYQPNEGKVNVHGKLVPFIELGVGFNPELTGRENVYMNGALLGFSEKEVGKFYDEVVEFAELEKFMDKKLKNYSSGMQVRLAFSMAIRANADVLLVDEVLAVGDTDFQLKCYDFFRQLKRYGKTVVFVTHDMNAVREYCDRALLIDNSTIIQEGTAQKITGEYSKLFLKEQENHKSTKKTEDRWGSGYGSIRNPKINKLSNNKLDISFMLSVDRDIHSPVIGYYLTNAIGQQICGTNTLLLEERVVSFKKGKKQSVNFVMDNILSDGKYDLTIAILSDNGSAVVDWWTDASSIVIKKSQHVPYLVDAPVKFIQKDI